ADGASFNNFLKNFLKEAVANLSDDERKALNDQLVAIDKAAIVSYDVKPRPVVKEWKMDDLVSKLDKVDRGRSFEKGKEAELAGQCIRCHRFGDKGGGAGPDLTAVSSRFDRRSVLESIIEPSKVISEQFMNEQIVTKRGRFITGRVVDETSDTLVLQPNPLSPERVTVKKSDLDKREPSKVSPMPDHLIDVLTEAEVLDLLAYLESAGNRGYRSFRP